MHKSKQIPVMISEVVEGLQLSPTSIIIDATVGGGGHAIELLEASKPNGKLLGIDWDASAVKRTKKFLQAYQDRATIVEGSYTDIKNIALKHKFSEVNAIHLDLGLSLDQLKDETRGFGINTDGPLDMRYSSQAPTTAFEIVNTWPEKSLEKIFTEYGEERHAQRVAQQIIASRKLAPINTTKELADVVVRGVKARGRLRVHPATRVFQALRIATNKELDNLARALPDMIDILSKGGRMTVLTFHSLEDRIVKFIFRAHARSDNPTIALVNKHVIKPTREEILSNRPSRSAKLRIIEKII